eukprot:snap_masked-scaffold160_size295910-processed-gene-1.8 protein:Tk01230 transcript:snap_masked-scaffold160_size295910-processed-gene-1.8-mRNA-1 annotation:"zinc finger protein 2 homolog"
MEQIKVEPEEAEEMSWESSQLVKVEIKDNVEETNYFRCYKCDYPFQRLISCENHQASCKTKGPLVDPKKIQLAQKNRRKAVLIMERSFFQDQPDESGDDTETSTSSSPRFFCVECQMEFLGVIKYAQHQYAHCCMLTTKDTSGHICSDCGQEFMNLEQARRHIGDERNTCIDEPKVTFTCQICQNVFNRKDVLRNHLLIHTGTSASKRTYKCRFCQRVFGGVTLLEIHLRSHTGTRAIACQVCRKTFPSRSALKKHDRTHTGEKPFPCPFCSSTFLAQETLNRHMKTHKKEGSTKKHVCQPCDRSFSREMDLSKHLNLVHVFHFDRGTRDDDLVLKKNGGPQSGPKTYIRKRPTHVDHEITIKDEPIDYL